MLFFAHNFPAIDRQSNSVISIMSEGETLLQKKKKSLIARPGTSILCSIKQAIHWLFCSGVAAVVFSITGFGGFSGLSANKISKTTNVSIRKYYQFGNCL